MLITNQSSMLWFGICDNDLHWTDTSTADTQLVAVDADGNRSEIASKTIPADSTDTGTLVPVSGGIEPPDITGTAYSASDIEIFWPRIEATNITYTVFRGCRRLRNPSLHYLGNDAELQSQQ